MCDLIRCFSTSVAAALLLVLAATSGLAAVSENLLRNPSFEEGADANGVPIGWGVYAGGGAGQRLSLVPTADAGRQALRLEDGDPNAEIGITQSVDARPGLAYRATARVRGIEDATWAGAYLQMRFLPSNEFVQTSLAAPSSKAFTPVSVKALAPADTKQITLYLYTHSDPTPRLLIDSVELISGVEPPPPPPPAPVPPQYTKLKDLHLATALVNGGKPAIAIVVPASGLHKAQAAYLQKAIQAASGVAVPIITDRSPRAAVPIRQSLILLGNRSTNRAYDELYNRFFTLTDLRYPGPGGYEVRSVHNPFGGGHNVILVGGSDAKGVAAAARVLAGKIRQAGDTETRRRGDAETRRRGDTETRRRGDAETRRRGDAETRRAQATRTPIPPHPHTPTLSVGWLMEIHLGTGVKVPKELKDFEIWEASRGYGSSGYFGWNSISKRMAMYYMTGDRFHAREALRLAFPDKQAFEELTRIDGECIENKGDPLAGPYHYNAHMMILFWDLIEESPVFTDDERLKVANAFARQLNHRKDEGIYGLRSAPPYVGSRHGQWSAVSLYCLGRYFQKDYPNRIWQQCVEGARWAFGPLHEHAWVSGENDNLFWYNTAIAPIFTFLLLDGDRTPVKNGVLRRLLLGQEQLVSGLVPDWALNSAAIDLLHKAAYLMQDGRYVLYRQRAGIDTGVFRLGQSFWPEAHLKPAPPKDLAGKWSINTLPLPAWEDRASGIPYEESFYFGSFRSAADGSGDYILLDGFNGESRNPYHTFAILELRLGGNTLLKGYRNQVLTRADGMVEPRIAMNAALRYRDVVGGTAAAVAEVPDAAYSNWRRMLAQRAGRYALVVDDLTFRTDSDNIEVQTLWETPGGVWEPEAGAIRLQVATTASLPEGWRSVPALETTVTTQPAGPEMLARLPSLGIVVLRAKEPGAWMELAFRLQKPFDGEVYAEFLNYVDRGKVRLFLDGKPVGEEFDNYASGVSPARASLGRLALAAGEHRLRAQATARRRDSDKCYVGLAGLSLRPEGAPGPSGVATCRIRSSDLLRATAADGVITQEWRGAVQKGQHRLFFHLVGEETEGAPLQCLRLADNAAALLLPPPRRERAAPPEPSVPAIAVAGSYAGTHAELAVLAQDHLFGRALTQATAGGTLVAGDTPVDVDWDYRTGILHLVAPKDANVGLALGTADVRLDGKPVAVPAGEAGLTILALPAGRHRIEGARPEPSLRRGIAAHLAAALDQARQAREHLAAATPEAAPALPALTPAFAAPVGGKVVALVSIPSAGGPLVCAAEGKTVHVLAADGKEVRRLEADGSIRVLRWWPEHKLLLVGCVDEKVIAFDEAGQRKWVFVSEMDPAVFRAAKQYWFKSAPGHEGIHGLYTGTLIEGKSQAFVGSACTLEILDENGKLVKRLPVFWGTGAVFEIVPGPGETRNLLVGRSITDGSHLAIVNSKTLEVAGGGYNGVPAGATYVGGWACMSRDHLFYEDLDGDGVREMASEINGTWNRVTVWKEDGTPLHDASFGPGDSIPVKDMRDLDVADLDGDGKQEILAATSSGLVVALDCQCRKVWARRLESPPTVLQAVTAQGAAWIVVGCQDGSVVVLDGKGTPVRRDQVAGAPTRILAVEGPVVVLATDQGEVKAFRIP